MTPGVEGPTFADQARVQAALGTLDAKAAEPMPNVSELFHKELLERRTALKEQLELLDERHGIAEDRYNRTHRDLAQALKACDAALNAYPAQEERAVVRPAAG